MSALSDKLKALGVKLGARDLHTPSKPNTWSISQIVPGKDKVTPFGETFLVEASYPSPFSPYSNPNLASDNSPGILNPLDLIATWAGDQRILTRPLTAYAFLDIETTGLSGGTGTYAFLVGIAKYKNEQLHLAQFFMRDPSEEAAHLYAVDEFLASCEVLVTFNGKAFDAPLLAARFLTNGNENPFKNVAHLDLLHLSRRLWRDRLPNRSLGSIEVDILGLPRTSEDIPGWQIPQMYFDYIHTGDARPLVPVFYHNAIDVVSLASLLEHITHLLHDPLHAPQTHVLDLFAISRLFDDLGYWQEAIPLYQKVINQITDEMHRQDAIRRLSILHKRHADWDRAIALWQIAAEAQQLYALEELAKYYEHLAKHPHEALHWTLTALEYLHDSTFPNALRTVWEPEFEHRLARLKKIISFR